MQHLRESMHEVQRARGRAVEALEDARGVTVNVARDGAQLRDARVQVASAELQDFCEFGNRIAAGAPQGKAPRASERMKRPARRFRRKAARKLDRKQHDNPAHTVLGATQVRAHLRATLVAHGAMSAGVGKPQQQVAEP